MTSCSRCTKPDRAWAVNSTEPVTINGFWYSSPIFFQKSTLAKIPSSGCRSFSSLIRDCWTSLDFPLGCACAVVFEAGVGVGPPAGEVAGDAPLALVSPLSVRCSLASSSSGSTSASMTFSCDFERSWLRSSRTVSRLASTSSEPPARNPAISTRWNGETSIFGWMGVSIGTSYTSLHALTVSASARLATTAAVRAVIDFLEELVILANELVVGLELERALVRLARLLELALVLVRDRQVVERRGVVGVDLRGLLPPVNRFPPEALLRDGDPELDVLLRGFPRVLGRRGRRHRHDEQGRGEDLSKMHSWNDSHYTEATRTPQGVTGLRRWRASHIPRQDDVEWRKTRGILTSGAELSTLPCPRATQALTMGVEEVGARESSSPC